MGWKSDLNNAVRDYLNEQHNLNAVKVTDIYDHAAVYMNSLGYADADYIVDLYYETADGKPHCFTYQGRFTTLMEMLTDA